MQSPAHPHPRLARTLWLALAAATGVAATAGAQTTLVANSPFAPSGAAAGAFAAPAQDFELAGSTSEGSNFTVCIYERQTRRSQWIPVGGISDGIRVVSYDANRDQAVVVIGGVRKDITMRKPTFTTKGVANAPASVAMAAPSAPAPVADDSARRGPEAPAAAGKPEQEQREARMLVSDLLEIGVQQRKAYQEARQKAAAGTPTSPSN